MTFSELEIIHPIIKALDAEGYTQPTPIQEKSIPILLKGYDLLGCAQTGTGKTAAFAIPILQLMHLDRKWSEPNKKVQALIVTPTRELAIQIGDSFSTYGKHTKLRNTVIFGGVKQHSQTQTLNRGVDILIATPGRLLDLMNQGFISLKDIKYFVLDEADRMLDMGFIHDIRKIIAKLPVKRQSLFFSATMAPEIVLLSKKILGNPEKVTIKPEQTTAEKVEQSIYFVNKKNKPKLLVHLLNSNDFNATLVFSRTKYGADKISKLLNKNDISSAAIHGNKSQGARQKALNDFKGGKLKVLVATDIAARGIDIDDLGLVINFDLPNIPESYVHRIGRTGRANASGKAISFCAVDEKPFLRDIERLINQKIQKVNEHPFIDDSNEAAPEKQKTNFRRKNKVGGSNNKQGGSQNHRRSNARRKNR